MDFAPPNTTQHLLSFLCLFIFAGLGRFIYRGHFLTSCLIGLSCAGLLAGAVVNFRATAAYPIILFSYLAALFFMFWVARRNEIKWSDLFHGWGLGVFFVCYFINDPLRALFVQLPGGEVRHYYEGHNAYYYSLVFETLNADYPSRLRIMDFFPREWPVYHFFSAGAYAALLAPIKKINLMHYLLAERLATAAVIGAITELLIPRKASFRTGMMAVFCLVIGTTLFEKSVLWSLRTSAWFSVFAIVGVVGSLIQRDRVSTLFFGILLSAASIRLIPYSAGIAVVLTCCWLRDLRVRGELKKAYSIFLKGLSNHKTIVAYFILFFAYLLITLTSRSFSRAPYFGPVDSGDGWLGALSGYRIIGMIWHYFEFKPVRAFTSYNYGDVLWFAKENPWIIWVATFAAMSTVIAGFCWFALLVKESYGFFYKKALWILGVGVVLSFALTPFSFDYFKHALLNTLMLSAMLPLSFAIHRMVIEQSKQDPNRNSSGLVEFAWVGLGFIVWSYASVISSISDEKGANLYIGWDLFLWASLSYYLIQSKRDKTLLVCLVLLLIPMFPFKTLGIFEYTPNPFIFRISELRDEVRTEWTQRAEAWSVFKGERILYDEKNMNVFLNGKHVR